MTVSVEEVLSRSFALKKLYVLLRQSLLRLKSPDRHFLDEEAQMLLKDLLDFAVAGIVGALRKIIAAKEYGRTPAIPARWDGTTIESPSVMPPNFPGNLSSNRGFDFRVKKDGLHCPNTTSQPLATGPFSIGTSSGELDRKRICRVCSRKKQLVSDIDPSLPENRLFGQLSDAQKVDYPRTDAEGNHGMGNHSDREKCRETERSAGARTFGSPLSRKRPVDAGFTTVVRPLDERSKVAKEVAQRISEIEAGILAIQLSSLNAKPMENTYRRRRNGVGSAINSPRGTEEWKRPVQSRRSSVKDVNHRGTVPALMDSTEAMIANPKSTSQSASDEAEMSSSGTHMIHGLRVASSHADVYKTSGSRSQRRLTSKESLCAAKKTPKSRSRISPDSVSQRNESEGESDSSYHRYKSFKRIPMQSHGHTNRRTSRIYESGSDDHGSGESQRSREIMVTKRPEKYRQSSPCEPENSGSRLSSLYFPSSRWSSSRGSSTFRELYSSSPSSREYSADSESSNRLYGKGSSYTYSIPSHRGRLNPLRIQGRRREFETHIQANHEKAVGRLRRLKNKLGLIFHHHHHHHHHHHEQDTIRKPLQDAFRRKDGGEVVKRLRNGNGLAKSGNDQVGHFCALLQGLLSHLRRSKKYEGNVRRNHRAKNLHWWQTLRRRRRGRTMRPGREGAKLKLGGRRPLIKAPKMIR